MPPFEPQPSRSEFEQDLLASICWQLKGFSEGHVGPAATARMLRASLRKLRARHIGRSAAIGQDSVVEADHVVPLKVLSDALMNDGTLTPDSIRRLIDRYLLIADLTREEHRDHLSALQSTMPDGWNIADERPDNHLSRYVVSGITIVPPEDTRPEVASGGGDQGGAKFPMDAFNDYRQSNAELRELWDEMAKPEPGRIDGTRIRRGLAIILLESEGLLQLFLDAHWKLGNTPKGATHMRYCRRAAEAFRAESN